MPLIKYLRYNIKITRKTTRNILAKVQKLSKEYKFNLNLIKKKILKLLKKNKIQISDQLLSLLKHQLKQNVLNLYFQKY